MLFGEYMFCLIWLGCFQQPSSFTKDTEEYSRQLIIIRSGPDDIVENIAHALSYKKIIPEKILFIPGTDDFAHELQKQYTSPPKMEQTSTPYSLDLLPSHARTVVLIISTPQLQMQNIPPLNPGNYVVFESKSKQWTDFFEQHTERISPLLELSRFSLPTIQEPSGLAIHPKSNHLWTVSDETGGIFDLGIDARAPEEAHSHLAFQITDFEENDLEGIAFIDGNACILVESQRRMLCYDQSWTQVSNQRIEGPYTPQKDNKGPEGLSNDGIILNEGFPTAISNTGRILRLGTDVSGIAKDGEFYWILSQTDATISLLNSEFILLHTYSFPDEGLEGIVVHGSEMFLVSDPNSMLYHVRTPQK
jgi:hypothetical protein